MHKILVVDDNPLYSLIVTKCLEHEHGRESKIAVRQTIADAIDLLASESFDLLIVDCMMSGGFGSEVVDALRTSHSSDSSFATKRDIPVIVASAVGEARLSDCGFDFNGGWDPISFIPLPVDPSKLRQLVGVMLGLVPPSRPSR